MQQWISFPMSPFLKKDGIVLLGGIFLPMTSKNPFPSVALPVFPAAQVKNRQGAGARSQNPGIPHWNSS